MCQIVQRVWIGRWLNDEKKTEYLILRNGQCVCMRPAERLTCNKAIQPEPPQSAHPASLLPLHALELTAHTDNEVK